MHVLSHKWEWNSENTWTQGGKQCTPRTVGVWGTKGGRALGQRANAYGAYSLDGGLKGLQTTMAHVYLYKKHTCSALVS